MKSKKIVLFTLIAVAALGVLAWIAQPRFKEQPNAAAAAESGALAAQEPAFDFGTISMGGGKVSHTFTVTNTSDKPVTIQTLYTSCMCTTATFVRNGDRLGPFGMQGMGFIPHIDQTLAPGESAGIEAVFDPAAHGPAGVGTIDRVIYLEESTGSVFTLGFHAVVTP